MSNSKDLANGLIIECLPNTTFKIQKPDGSTTTAYLGGKMKINKIRLMVGDKVEYVIDKYGNNNRITSRLKQD